MFEPIGAVSEVHRPKRVNPLAAICSGALMLEHLGENQAAKAIEDTVIVLPEKDQGSWRRPNWLLHHRGRRPRGFFCKKTDIILSRAGFAPALFALGQAGLQLGQAAPILPPPLGD